MNTMIIQVPDALEKEYDETIRLIAAKLYEAGKLTLRQAAEMCQLKKWDFAEILIKYDVHYLDQGAIEDLEAFRHAHADKDGIIPAIPNLLYYNLASLINLQLLMTKDS